MRVGEIPMRHRAGWFGTRRAICTHLKNCLFWNHFCLRGNLKVDTNSFGTFKLQYLFLPPFWPFACMSGGSLMQERTQIPDTAVASRLNIHTEWMKQFKGLLRYSVYKPRKFGAKAPGISTCGPLFFCSWRMKGHCPFHCSQMHGSPYVLMHIDIKQTATFNHLIQTSTSILLLRPRRGEPAGGFDPPTDDSEGQILCANKARLSIVANLRKVEDTVGRLRWFPFCFLCLKCKWFYHINEEPVQFAWFLSYLLWRWLYYNKKSSALASFMLGVFCYFIVLRALSWHCNAGRCFFFLWSTFSFFVPVLFKTFVLSLTKKVYKKYICKARFHFTF